MSTTTIDAVRARLPGAVHDGALALTDDLLGLPLLTSLFGAVALPVRNVTLDLTAADTVALHGVVDVLDVSEVAFDLALQTGERDLEAHLHLSLPLASAWGPPGLSVTAAELELTLGGDADDRRLGGALTGTTAHGSVAIAVVVPVGGTGPWVGALRLEGETLAIITDLGADLVAGLVGDGAPLGQLGDVDHVELTFAFDPRARRLDRVSVDLAVPLWQPIADVAVNDLMVFGAVEHPGDAARRSIVLAIDATCSVGGVGVPVHLERSGPHGSWDLRLAGATEAPPFSLTDLVAAFGGGDLASALPPEVTGMPSVRLGDVHLTVDPTARPAARAVSSLSFLLDADWEVVPGRLSLRQGHAALDVVNPGDPATRQIGVGLGGVVDLGGVAFALSADRPLGPPGGSPFVFRGGLVPGTAVTLQDLLTAVGGADVGLPDEIADVTVTTLSASFTPATGAFALDAAAEVPWSLPFGAGGLAVGRSELHVERGPAPAGGPSGARGPLQATLRLSGVTPARVVDGLDLDGFTLTYTYAPATWSLSGSLAIELFDAPVTLAASLTTTATERRFTFGADATANPVTVDLAGLGTLTARQLSLQVARPITAGRNGGRSVGPGAGGGPGGGPSATTWEVRADGRLGLLDGTFDIGGTLTVRDEPGRSTLSLQPAAGRASTVDVTLPGAPSMGMSLGLGAISVVRTTEGPPSWTIQAAANAWFRGMPGDLARLLPASSATALRGTLELATGAAPAVTFALDPVLPRQSFTLPPVVVGDTRVDLSKDPAAIEIGRLDVRWSRVSGLEVGTELAIGLPASLNRLLGDKVDVFTTFDPAKPESMVRFRLAAVTGGGGGGGGPTLELAPLTSAFKKLTLVPTAPGSTERKAVLDLGRYGSLELVVPTIGYQGQTFRARGGFRQKDLALPLSPLKWLLGALDLGGLARLLPDRLPLEQVSLLDDAGRLSVDRVYDRITGALQEIPGLHLPDEPGLRRVLQTLTDHADRLPTRLWPYLDPKLPEQFSFDLAVTTTGGVQGSVGVGPLDAQGRPAAGAQPIRLLVPGLSVAGPVLNGIELWNLSVGEIFGGAAMLVRAEVIIDQFDLVPLAVVAGLPDEVVAGLPVATEDVTRRLVAKRLVIVVVPEAVVAVPLFFDDLGVEYRGIEGIEVAAHLSLPEPRLDLPQALKLFHELGDFFTKPGASLDEHALDGPGLDLRLTAGPFFLALPAYLGGRELGSRTATTTISAFQSLVHLLNGLKGFRLDELLASLPPELLHAPPAPKPHLELGPLIFDGAWDVTAPAGAERAMAVHLEGTGTLGPVAGVAAQLDLRSAGSSDLGAQVAVDGTVARFLALHLDGRLDVGAGSTSTAAAGAGPAFVSPAARMTAPGPTWTPTAFTVEWWLYPTSLADYNQTIAGDDRWGSFVFHTTAGGAVYVGTDVLTRLTPTELPAGTVRVGAWQHFAFTYQSGTAFLFKDGVVVARKDGLAAPRPWTGLRLGTSAAGSGVQGRCTEVRVWDHALAATNILAGLHQRSTGTEPGLVAYWPLTEGTGTVAHDRGPSHFDATLMSTEWPTGSTTIAAPLPAGTGSSAGSGAGSGGSGAGGGGGSGAGPATPFQLTGNSSLSVLGRTAYRGHVAIQPGRVAFDGHLDLFPGNPTFQVIGNLAGAIDAQHFELAGNANVAIGGFVLSSGSTRISDQGLAVDGRWLETFTTQLAVDGRAADVVLSGSITGELSLSTLFGPVFSPNGNVKLADSFPLASLASLNLSVTISEAIGLRASGDVRFPVNGQPQRIPLALDLGNIPTTRQQFDQLVVAELRRHNPLDYFTLLYQDADAWAHGAANGLFGWARSAWADTSKALRLGYGQTAVGIAGVLSAAKFTGAEIGHVLRAELVSDAATLIRMLQQAGFEVQKVADAVYGAFEQDLGRDAYASARSVISMMRNWYGAVDMGTVARRNFGLNANRALGLLREQSYIPREVAAAATGAYQLVLGDAASVFHDIGVAASDAIDGLARAYAVDKRELAKVLNVAGYATATLNGVLDALRLPRI